MVNTEIRLIIFLAAKDGESESESEVSQSCLNFCNPMDSRLHQAPLSMGFSRQEYWSGLPFPSPGNLPNPGTEPRSLTFIDIRFTI